MTTTSHRPPGRPGDGRAEETLRVSGLDYFDVFQFHVWHDEWIGRGERPETVQDLKREGKIRFFGVSINDFQPENALALVESGAVDTVQVIYNVFHQQPSERLLPACEEHGVGVIVRVALDGGGPTGQITADTVFEQGDFRASYFTGARAAEVEHRVRALDADLNITTDQTADVAPRYVWENRAVSIVIVGMRSVRNVERNARSAEGRRLSPQQPDLLGQHRWERNFYLTD